MNNRGFVFLRWIGGLSVVLLLAGGWYYYHRTNEDAPQFQTVAVTRSDLTQTVTATGTLNPVLNVTVGSQISGIIQSLYADFNTRVTNGQVIAQLDPATYQANVMSAEADLANATAQLELAQLNARRSEELLKNKLVSQSDADQTTAALHQAEAQVQIKKASLNRARVDYSRCTIYAPVDGIVIDRKVDVGQTVAASMSAPVLFQIANDLTQMQINASVAEADIGAIAEGHAVTFTVDAFPNRTFKGRLTQIRNSPTTVQNVVTYDAIISVTNADLKLKPGMTATVAVITAQATGSLSLRNAAFRFKPSDAITNLILVATAPTNATNPSAAAPALTGDEPPEVLQKRAAEMRERGEEIPAAIRDKLRSYYQSGGFRGEGGENRPRSLTSNAPGTRTVYRLVVQDGHEKLERVAVKTGINDGTATEIISGLNEGDQIVIPVTTPNAPAAAPGSNPFGGGMIPRR